MYSDSRACTDVGERRPRTDGVAAGNGTGSDTVAHVELYRLWRPMEVHRLWRLMELLRLWRLMELHRLWRLMEVRGARQRYGHV